MNRRDIQVLVDLLQDLEEELRKFPELANQYKSSINAIGESLSNLLGQDILLSTKSLTSTFGTLFNSIVEGSLKGEQGLSQVLDRVTELNRVTGALAKINAPIIGTPEQPQSQVYAEPGEIGNAWSDASIKILTNLRDIEVTGKETFDVIEKETKEATKEQREFAEALGITVERQRELKGSKRIPTTPEDIGVKGKDVVSFEDFSKSLDLTKRQAAKLDEQLNKLEGSTGSYVKIQKDAHSGTLRLKISTEQLGKAIKTTDGDTVRLANSYGFIELKIDKAGRVVAESTGKWKSFGDQIIRNVGEVAKWSFAVGAVYGTIARLGDLIEQSIENQTKLAEINIVVGDSQRDLNEIFKEALSIANATGSSVQGVLDSYADAIRVTSSVADESERFSTANQLLEDSLILSKLGVIDQADAMDLLVASLQQANRELTEGRDLLDKWVETSNKAGVTLNDLATAYSITAGAAADAGVEVGGATDELSAIIATIAESFPYEGRELGNRVRALIASTTDPARQQNLFDIGVSPVNVENELRPFLEIYTEVAEKFREGLITEDDIGKIAGGNVRQRNILISLIDKLNRVQEINADTANSAGAAQSALSIQLETVKTSIDKLGNAFTNLGQTLGTSGGILESVSAITDGLTGLIDVLENIIGLTGRAGPALALILGGNLVAQRAFGGANPLSAVATAGTKGAGRVFGAIGGNALLGRGGSGDSAINAVKTGEKIAAGFGNALPGILTSAFQIAISDSENKVQELGATTAGAIVGGLVGGPIGSIVGSQIVIGFIDALKAEEHVGSELGESIAQGFRESLEADPPDIGEKKIDQEAINEFVQENTDALQRVFSNLVFSKEGAIQGLTEAGVDEELVRGFAESEGVETSTLSKLQSALFSGEGRESRLELITELEEILQVMLDIEVAAKVDEDAFDSLETKIVRSTSKISDSIRQELKDAFFAEDGISGSVYFDLLEQLGQVPSSIASIRGTFGEDLIDSLGLKDDQELFETLFNFIIRTTPEVRNELQKLATIDPLDSDAYLKGLQDITDFVQNYKVPETFGNLPATPPIIDISGLSEEEFSRVLENAEVLALNFEHSLAKIFGEDLASDMMEGMRETIIIEAEGIYEPLFDLNSTFVRQALQDQRQISSSASKGTSLSIQDIDLPSSQFGQILETMNFFASQLGQLGYQSQTSPTVLRFSDDVIQVKDIDSQLLRLALDELIEVNRDQLEGIYNLPTDGSFFVPFTGYDLGQQGDESGIGDLPFIDVANSDQFESATGVFSGAVDKFAALMTPKEAAKAQGVGSSPLSTKSLSEAIFDMFGAKKQGTGIQSFGSLGPRSTPGGEIGGGFLEPIESLSSSAQELKEVIKGLSSGDGKYGKSLDTTSETTQQYENVLTAIQQLTTKELPPLDLNIQMQASFQSILDGRIIAESVKQFIVQDLLRFQSSGGGGTVRYVV